MSKKNLPNMPLYIGDWQKDCNVLSLEAEAAWLRIIFKMFTNGKQSLYKIPTKGLQNIWRCSGEKAKEIVQELVDFDICEITEQERFTLFKSRRFERENQLSKVRCEAVKSRKDRKNPPQIANKPSTKPIQTLNKTQTKGLQITDNDNDNENNNEIESEEEKGGVGEKTNCQHIAEQFNALCSALPAVRQLTPKRRAGIRARVSEYGPEQVEAVFRKTAGSSFLTGDNDRGWQADFDWVLKPNNFIKILEGQYDDKHAKHPTINRQSAAVIASNSQGWEIK